MYYACGLCPVSREIIELLRLRYLVKDIMLTFIRRRTGSVNGNSQIRAINILRRPLYVPSKTTQP